MDSNMIVDISQDISPDGGITRQTPMSDVDRALAAGRTNKGNSDTKIKDLEVVDESVDNSQQIDTDPSKDDVDFNSFLKEAGKEIQNDESTDEDKIKDKVEADKSEDEKKVVVEHDDKQSTQQTNKKPNVDKTINRDYSDIDDDHKELFKRMHNDAYNLLKPVYKEHKVLKTENEKLKKDYEDTSKLYKTLKDNGPQLPDNYFENPNGYLLDPEFQTSVRTLNDAQTVLNHWDKQYKDVAAGAKEFDYLDRDPKTGQLYIKGKIKADAGVEMELLKYVNHAQQYVNDSNASIRAIQMSHGSKSAEAIKSLKSNTQKEYGAFDLPDNKPIYEPLIKAEYEQLSPVFRNSPLAESYVKARVMVYALAKLLQQAKGEKVDNDNNKGNTNGNNNKSTNSNNKNTRNKQPSQEEINGAVGNPTDKDKEDNNVTYDDFNKVKGIEM